MTYLARDGNRSSVSALVRFVALVLILWSGPLVAYAQQQESAQQQRPRRAGYVVPAPDAAVGEETPAGEEVGDGDVVRVETRLVPIPVVVRDREGKPVMGLTASDFQIYEDGRLQSVAAFATSDVPFEVALLLDTSGSTRAEIALIRRAAYAFIESLRPGDRVAILSFKTAEEGREKYAAAEVQSYLTDNREALRAAIENIGASNGTPYYNALERVAQEIFRDPPEPSMRGRRALVALTDGVDSTSDSDFADARARLLQAGVLTYFIQVNTEEYVEDRLLMDCQGDGALRLSQVQLERYRRIFVPRAAAADYTSFCQMGQFERMTISRSLYQLARQEMGELARDSGGRTFEAPDLGAAQAAFAEVAAEIGRQYSLGYYSTNKAHDGAFRRIRVEVRGLQGAQVSAREGYQSPRG